MKPKISLIPVLLLFLLLSCKGNGNNKQQHYTYADGEYVAEISYYNPKTRTQSEYTLNVEIENDLLVRIYWSNGGWLDDSHFTPPNISTGEAFFVSDKGYQYKVRVVDDDVFDSDAESDDNICPECGYYKYSTNEYCDDCQERIEEDE